MAKRAKWEPPGIHTRESALSEADVRTGWRRKQLATAALGDYMIQGISENGWWHNVPCCVGLSLACPGGMDNFGITVIFDCSFRSYEGKREKIDLTPTSLSTECCATSLKTPMLQVILTVWDISWNGLHPMVGAQFVFRSLYIIFTLVCENSFIKSHEFKNQENKVRVKEPHQWVWCCHTSVPKSFKGDKNVF